MVNCSDQRRIVKMCSSVAVSAIAMVVSVFSLVATAAEQRQPMIFRIMVNASSDSIDSFDADCRGFAVSKYHVVTTAECAEGAEAIQGRRNISKL